MGKVRVLHVLPNRSWGGAEIQMIEIAKWTREVGVEPKIWCIKDSPIYKEATRLGLTTVTDPLPLKGVVPPLWKILKVLRRENVDIVHLHWAAGMRLFFGVKFFLKLKFIFYNHMWVTLTKRDLFHKIAYSQMDALTISGPLAENAVLKHLPVSKSQLIICPYGIDIQSIPAHLLNPKGRPPGLRAKWSLPEEALVFGFFGRIDRQKGVKEFVETADELLGQFPNIHYLLVGDPTLNEVDAIKYKEEVFELMAKSPYKDRIHHFGHQSDFHSPMACCDLVVMPSYMECYSILILHAFALGLPVVSTNAGGTPDLISAPRRGWLVEPRSAESLKETLIEIAKNPGEIEKKSHDCQEYVSAHHSASYVAGRFKKIYDSILIGAPLDF